MAFLAYRWAATIVQEWGQKPSQHAGQVFGFFVSFLLILFLIDYVLWRCRFTLAVRSGLWAAAALGPMAALTAWMELMHPVWSHVIGLLSTILSFIAFYFLERWLQGKHLAHEE